MALTIREQMLAALAAVLEGITSIDNLCVERNRDTEVGEFPTLVIHDGDQAPKEGAEEDTCARYFTAIVVLEGHVQADKGENIGTTLNALYGAVLVVLFADVHLGGLSDDIREGAGDFGLYMNDSEVLTAAFSLIVEVDYAVDPTDPTAQPS